MTEVVGGSPVVLFDGIAVATQLDGILVRSADAVGPDASSYAVVVRSSHGIRLRDVVIEAGRGADGADGADGVDRAAPGPGVNGADGQPSCGGGPSVPLVCLGATTVARPQTALVPGAGGAGGASAGSPARPAPRRPRSAAPSDPS